MLSSPRVSRLLFATLLGFGLVTCTRTQVVGKCTEDADCPMPTAAWRCEPVSGACYCRTNDACPPAQFCNVAGYCQDRAGCEKNADCLDPSLYCDTSAGTCVSRGRCTSDIHCGLGEVCNTARQVCVTGCKSHGDCPGTSCRCGDVACTCTGTTAQERAACRIGECDSQFCADSTFCRFGEICQADPDAGFPRARCTSDFDVDTRPYCARCTSGGGTDTCGRGANYCIIDTRTASTYCGADCSEGQQCPRGYGCRDIRIVLTRWQCSATQACPPIPAFPCGPDAGCPRGGECIIAPGQQTGSCAGRCRLREGSSFGYCSCLENLDCPQQTCSQGECSINRKRCVNDVDCQQIRCVDFDGIGACHIGENCTPINGLTCLEVQ